MHQSYKTNLRFLFLLLPGLLLLFAGGVWPAAGIAQMPARPKHKMEVFLAYHYRFILPDAQADQIWKYLRQQQLDKKDVSPQETDEGNLIDLYFDSPDNKLLKQNLALRERLFLSGEGRRKVVQLLRPVPDQPYQTQELEFRLNRKPDKGSNFTSHPLLKLIRTKDRLALDSVLQPYQIRAAELGPTLEVTQNRRRLFLRRQGSNWLEVTFTQLKSEAPEHVYTELEVAADRKLFTQTDSAGRQKLREATDTLAAQLMRDFPDLEPEFRSDYEKMTKQRQTTSPDFTRTKIIFGLVLLLALVGFFFLRKKFRKDLE